MTAFQMAMASGNKFPRLFPVCPLRADYADLTKTINKMTANDFNTDGHEQGARREAMSAVEQNTVEQETTPASVAQDMAVIHNLIEKYDAFGRLGSL